MTSSPADKGEEPILITSDMLAPKRTGRAPDGRIDFERGMRRAPPVILTIIAVNIAVFVWEVGSGAFLDRKALLDAGGAAGQNLIEAGALVRDRVFAGEWWRTITSMFLHGGPEHLIGNMVALFIVGMGCEHAFGASRTALIYLWSGLSGAALSLATGPGPSVGASGAIFGVLAAVSVMLYRYQDQFFVRDKRIAFVLAAWAGWQLLTGFMSPFIDNFAHVGGMIGGASAALVLTPTLTDPARLPTR